MKKLLYLSIVFPVLIFIACEDKPDVYDFPVDKYVYDIPDVPVTEDYVVGVQYDTKYRDTLRNVWYDATKKAEQLYTGTPVLNATYPGGYDIKKDEDVLRQHLDWGKEAGIDFFILSWGGRGYNDTILTRWKQLWEQDPARPKVVVRFDPGYRFFARDTLQRNQLNMDTLSYDLDSVYTHIMMHNFAYKKADGKPVMILCNFTNNAQIPRLNSFVNTLKGSPAIDNNIWIMAELGGGWKSPEQWGYHAKNGYDPDKAPSVGYVRADTIKTFEAFFTTDISHNNYDRYYHQYSYLDYNYNYWQERLRPLNKEYVPTIHPSFDDRINTPSSDRYLTPRWKMDGTGAYVISSSSPDSPLYDFSSVKENPYKKFADVAKRNVGPSRMVLIYNWNDFASGKNLEPVDEFGTDYLKYTKEFFKKP